jgi:hypothetical protein
MACAAWEEILGQGPSAGVDTSRWLIEHLLRAEHTDRAMRSVWHQMHTVQIPVHRDLAGFDFAASKVDEQLVRQLAYLIIGEIGSRDWIHSTHGRKIEKALEHNAGGARIAIIGEQHWFEQLG